VAQFSEDNDCYELINVVVIEDATNDLYILTIGIKNDLDE